LSRTAARAGGVLSVDLKALQRNYLKVQAEVRPAECGASVKADAYGIGMEPAAKALWGAGCRSFFVALPEEGKRLRRILPQAVIYVLGGLFAGEAGFYGEHSLRPALGQMREIDEWVQYCRAVGRRLPAALHIETGINRLGLPLAQLEELARRKDLFSIFELSLVISHLARGDEKDHEFNRQQLESFNSLRKLLPAAPSSLANSPGVFLGPAYHQDLVRPGIGLYGGNPFSARDNPFEAVATVEARILQVKFLKPGECVGYGCSFVAERPSRIAVIAAGYADGYPRSCSALPDGGPASVWLSGRLAPLVGRVSMDMITVDVTDVPEEPQIGDMAELMGRHVSVDDVARWSGSISYEILTRLGSRYLRLYSAIDS
jgi:alanine racemase